MFRIPSHFQMNEMTFEEAKGIISTIGGTKNLLDGLEYMNKRWEQHCSDSEGLHWEDDDHEFFDTWTYEVNAFNVVYKKMSPLFA